MPKANKLFFLLVPNSNSILVQQLVSDSVKMKQASSSLLSEKLMLQKQLQQVNTSLESSKLKIARGEEQVKTCVGQAIKTSVENWQKKKTRPAGVRPPPRHCIKKKTFSRRSRKPLNPYPTLTQRHRNPYENDQ
uniref:E3 ubiquitin protein ligase n=1 Tax=Arundo donax TaxID=35708 RepID=A0A0A9DEI2_ARUDO